MKHLLYSLLGILLLAGCKEDKYNVIIPMSDIYLSAPQDGAIIDLNDLSPSDKKAGTIDLVKGLLQEIQRTGNN